MNATDDDGGNVKSRSKPLRYTIVCSPAVCAESSAPALLRCTAGCSVFQNSTFDVELSYTVMSTPEMSRCDAKPGSQLASENEESLAQASVCLLYVSVSLLCTKNDRTLSRCLRDS